MTLTPDQIAVIKRRDENYCCCITGYYDVVTWATSDSISVSVSRDLLFDLLQLGFDFFVPPLPNELPQL